MTLLGLATALLLQPFGQVALADSSGKEFLTVRMGERVQSLDLADIESLELHETTLAHPEGLEGTFSGVWLDDFLQAQGLDDARRVRFIARDDYTTFLTPAERAEKAYLLVTRFEGDPLSTQQFGPLMLVVPADAQAVLDGTAPMTRWIWAIREISVR
jgi:hypothetical protein